MECYENVDIKRERETRIFDKSNLNPIVIFYVLSHTRAKKMKNE